MRGPREGDVRVMRARASRRWVIFCLTRPLLASLGATLAAAAAAPTTWSLASELVATDGSAGDHLGSSVAVGASGWTVAGAPDENDGEGAVYAFEFVANDAHAWVQRAKLTATDGEPGDGFGASVAMFDDERFVVVGAPGKNAAYVFERTAVSDRPWLQRAKISPATPGGAEDGFGTSVAARNVPSSLVPPVRTAQEECRTSAVHIYLTLIMRRRFGFKVQSSRHEMQEHRNDLDILSPSRMSIV